MNFDVTIDCRALFDECVDQTLIDYRNRTENGQSLAATHTLEDSLLDAFTINLRSVAENVRPVIAKHIRQIVFVPDLLLFRLIDISVLSPEGAAIRLKDALKYGMLAWWYGGKDAALFPYYRALFEKALLELQSEFIGTYTERPYRML